MWLSGKALKMQRTSHHGRFPHLPGIISVIAIAHTPFFNFFKCIHWTPTCSWHVFHVALSMKVILIKHPVSMRLCKSQRASTLISHRSYPYRAGATPEIRKPIPSPRYFTALKCVLVVTLLSGCFHLAVCPSGG